MQDIHLRVKHSPSLSTVINQGFPSINLLPQISLNCNDTNLKPQTTHAPHSPSSSEEDNSPTEMNNCRHLMDKPPLVKRLTMGIGLMRATEERRPLVHNTAAKTSSSLTSASQTISDGYVNEAICEPEQLISSKFGDSCRQSLTVLHTMEAMRRLHNEHNEFESNSSSKIFSQSTALKLDGLSLIEQNELKGAAWFQFGIPREISLEVLCRQNPGAFLVRQSSTKPGCFALSLRVPPPSPKVAHYLILRTQRGYKIKGFTKEFSSLRALITHHSVMRELLPVPLSLPQPEQKTQNTIGGHVINNRNNSRNGDFDGGINIVDDFETYGSLNDFRNMITDLNV